jgi:hypothetical protein
VALYHTILNANPEFVLLLVIFNDLLTKIEKAGLIQTVDIKVFAPNKKMLKIMMAIVVIKYAKLGAAKAYLLKNSDLLKGLDKALSYITEPSDDEAASRATNMRELMKDNIGILDNLVVANIIEMTEAIDAFKNMTPIPVEKIKRKKSEGTEPLPGFLLEMEGCKKQMGNIIHSAFAEQAPMWDGYVKIGSPTGTRKLALSVQYLDDATLARLKNVVVTVVSNTKTLVFKSNKLGNVKGYSMEEGNWTITSEFMGYDTVVHRDVAIKAGEIVRLVIRMKKRQ